ncbi:hypothetical protein H310_09817 [Aphanomyces invadans]|uniref:RING-type domain-containing protein n=1 Tax=Aphanomyces invadans TaxID=157072 RepID=A0A024TSK6_9STRA|nr:hypothetical protein H310_09817 [Aphanomyces invadans]ETV96964.1 hypothetical protein H310_09817 [Aphanomyces invadans]|eukprot:XP_008874210.1 hypothetical protein H310_09817 [Aphanomyces invadans]
MAPFAADPTATAKYAFFSCAAGIVAVASAYEKASLLSFSSDVVLQHLLASKWSLLVLLNVFGLILVRFFQVIVHCTLGPLATAEWKHLRESAFSFILLRCILLFNAIDWTVLDNRPLLHLVLWMALLTVVHSLFTALRRRFDTLGSTPLQGFYTTLVVLLLSLLATARLSLYMFAFPSVLCVISLSECAILLLLWLQLSLQLYLANASNSWQDGCTVAAISMTERKASVATLLLMALDVLALIGTACQYGWLRTLDGESMFRVSFLDFVLMLHGRQAIATVQRQYRQWKRLQLILLACDSTFETVSHSHEADVQCVICLHRLTMATKLPCGHSFHRHCLRQCLQTDQAAPHKCAVCRQPISLSQKFDSARTSAGGNVSMLSTSGSFLWPVQSPMAHRHSRAS